MASEATGEKKPLFPPNGSWKSAEPHEWCADVAEILQWARKSGFTIHRGSNDHPIIFNPRDGRSAEISGTPGGDVTRRRAYARTAIKGGLGFEDDARFKNPPFPGLVRTPEAPLIEQLGSPQSLILFLESFKTSGGGQYFDVRYEDGILTVTDPRDAPLARARDGVVPVHEVTINLRGEGRSWKQGVVEPLQELGIDLNLGRDECVAAARDEIDRRGDLRRAEVRNRENRIRRATGRSEKPRPMQGRRGMGNDGR